MKKNFVAAAFILCIYLKATGSQPCSGACGCCPPPCCCTCMMVNHTMPACPNALDLCLIVDTGSSFTPNDWNSLTIFLGDFSSQFSIGPQNTRVSLVTTTGDSNNHWHLNGPQTQNIHSLRNAFNSIPQPGGPVPNNLPAGLQSAADAVFNHPGDRPDVPNACVMFSDGQGNYPMDDLSQAASHLQDSAFVASVGLPPNPDYDVLEIAASGEEENHVFNADDSLDSLLEQLTEAVCEQGIQSSQAEEVEEDCFCCCPPPFRSSFSGAS